MNCAKVQSQICELSTDNLSARDASNMLVHFAACNSCRECWEEYEQTMFVLSTATQPIPGGSQTQLMWSYCQQRITETEIDSRYSSPARAALRNSIHETSGNNLWGWMGVQPRWGWTAAGGALAVLAATWFATVPAQNNANTPSITSAQLFAPSHFNTVDYPPAPAPNEPALNLPSYNSSSPTVFQAPTIPASQDGDRSNPLQNAAPSSVVSYTPDNTSPQP